VVPTPRTTPSRRQWQDWVVLLWPLVLAVALLLPLLTRSGHPLARDLVFVPRQPFTEATWGLGDAAPRAVPLDSVVAALTHVVDGGALARVVLPLTLALLGWGVARLVAPLGRTAQLVASGFAVWNAYVVERLALGQWALVLGCAALPWLVAAAMRYRREGRAGDLAAAVTWTALASLTPTGGLLALAGLVAAVTPHVRRLGTVVLAGAFLQAPWVVAALTGPAAAVSDASGVAAFAPDTESPYGPVVALLGLGGIWDARSEPASRTTWLALVAAVLVVLVVAVGLPGLRRVWGTGDTVRWTALAATTAGVTIAAATPWGLQAMTFLVESVPGAGLLRDTQKLLAPAVVLVSACAGACAGTAARRAAGSDVAPLVGVVLALAPLLVLPDATTRTWPTVTPVDLPEELEVVADRLRSVEGRVVTLPWRSYRSFVWAQPDHTSSDPLVRMADAEVVVSDALQVGSVLVPGESALAADIGAVLEDGSPADLASLGVEWVVLYADDPDAALVDTAGLEPVTDGEHVRLFRVPGADIRDDPGPGAREVAVWGAHLLALAVATTAAAVAVGARIRARRERDAAPRVMYPNDR
jgi:hypothetical protein